MTCLVVWLVATPEALSWDREYVDEEEIIAEIPHEERAVIYQTSFDPIDPGHLRAQTQRVQRCTRWNTQTVEIRQVLLETRTKKGELQTRRTIVGDPRSVMRDTPREQLECGAEPAAGIQVVLLGRELTTDADGGWSISLAGLRSDQLTSLSRGTISYTLRVDGDELTHTFPDEALRWASAGRTRLISTLWTDPGGAAGADEPTLPWPDPPARPLSELLEAYRGPWAIRSERDPLDDSQTLVASRSAEILVPAWRRSAHPALHARCSGGELALIVHLDTPAAHDRSRPDVTPVVVRLDRAPAQSLELIRSSDGEAVLFADPRRWMLALMLPGMNDSITTNSRRSSTR